MYVQYCRILVLRDSVATILGYDTGMRLMLGWYYDARIEYMYLLG